MTQAELFTEPAVCCVFCPHVVRRSDPDEAHDEMERHYATEHQATIDRLLGR